MAAAALGNQREQSSGTVYKDAIVCSKKILKLQT